MTLDVPTVNVDMPVVRPKVINERSEPMFVHQRETNHPRVTSSSVFDKNFSKLIQLASKTPFNDKGRSIS